MTFISFLRSLSLIATGASEVVSVPPAMPTSIWPSAILLATWIAAWRPVPHACWMSYAGVSGEPGAEHALAGQVEVAGVLEHRAGDDLAEPLALEAEAGDQPVERGGQHVLVGRVGVDAVGAGERDAVAAEDGDATGAAWSCSSSCRAVRAWRRPDAVRPRHEKWTLSSRHPAAAYQSAS